MRLHSISDLLRVFSLAAICNLGASASALFPCLRAVSSANRDFIVIVDTQSYTDQWKEHAELKVFPRETFINQNDEVLAEATLWTDRPLWSVILDKDLNCPVPLVTDDGEFVALLQLASAGSGATAIRIFRRRDHLGTAIGDWPDHGVFIKDVTLGKLWTSDQLAEVGELFNDGSPQWFAGGTFKFSSDRQLLIHKTRWHNTVRIKLGDGSVSKE